MARPRRAFGPLLHNTLIVGVCVLAFVALVRARLWSTGEPGTPSVDQGAKVAALVPGVATGEPGSRAAALVSLGEAMRGLAPGEPHARAMAAMRAALRDPDASVRAASAEALGLLGPSARPAVDGLTASLKDEDVDVRIAAARALLRIGGDVKAPALRALAGAVADPEPIPDRSGVVAAMVSAGEPGPDAAARALAGLLAHEDRAVRADAVGCVSALGAAAPRLRPALDGLLKADDPAIRYTAAVAAMRASEADSKPDPRIVTILADAIAAPSLPMAERQEALEALYGIDQQGIGALTGAVGSAFPAGSPASPALRRCGIALARQLEDRDPAVRLAAATLLHMIDPETLAGKE